MGTVRHSSKPLDLPSSDSSDQGTNKYVGCSGFTVLQVNTNLWQHHLLASLYNHFCSILCYISIHMQSLATYFSFPVYNLSLLALIDSSGLPRPFTSCYLQFLNNTMPLSLNFCLQTKASKESYCKLSKQ